MKINIIFTTVMLSIVTFTNAQIQEVSPPSTNTAALGKYYIFPNVNRTGTPEINIPLYTINERGFEIPISLSYHASGIKVEQIASWVGLGFSLSGTAMITRSVMDLPDDYSAVESINCLVSPPCDHSYLGWLTGVTKTPGENIQNFPISLDPPFFYAGDAQSEAFIGAQNTSTSLLSAGSYYGVSEDSQPDIFYINLFGRTSSFIFDSNRTPRFLDEKDWKIEYEMSVDQPITEFRVIDDSGVVYIMNQVETVTITKTYNMAQGTVVFPSSRNYNSAWLVSKVILPTSGSNIDFTYHTVNTSYDQNLFETASKYINGNYEVKTPSDIEKIEISSTEKLPKSIVSSNATALFNLGYDGRNDLSGGRYLDNLQIKNNGNEETVKRFTFDYTYMSSDNYCEEAKSVCDNHCPPGIQECFDECYNIYQSCAGLADDGNFHDKYRMFLSAVYETEAGVDDLCYCEKRLESCNSQCPNVQECFDECYVAFQSCEITNQSGTDCSQVVLSKLPAYQFSYNSLSLPPRLSKQQDFWGYYNANAENSLIPRVYVYPAYNEIRKKYSYLPRDNYQGNSYLMNGANRRANPPFAQAGILTKITYPTGGSSTYGYKSNEYYDIDIQKNIQGGGLRIEQITLFDGIDHGNDIVKNYSYNKYSDSSQSSGVLVNYPSFVRPVGAIITFNNHENWITYQDKINQGWSEAQLHLYFIKRVSNYFAPLSNLDGIHVSYTDVMEDINGIKTLYQYYKPNNYLDNASYVEEARLTKTVPQPCIPGIDPGPFVSGGGEDPRPTPYEFNSPAGVQDFGGGTSYIRPCMPLGESVPSNIDYGNIQPSGTNVYPFPPLSDDNFFHDGKLFKKIEFKVNGKEARETEYEYTQLNRRDGPKTIYGLSKGVQDVGWARTGGFASSVISWSKYSYKTGVASVLKKITQKTYSSNEDSFITEEQEFEYNGTNNIPYLMVKRLYLKNSDGSKAMEEFYYPPDLMGILSHMEDLVNSNRISSPIEIKNYKQVSGNNILLETKRNDYKLFGLSFDSVALIERESVSKVDHPFKENIIYNRYDHAGNICEYRQANGIPVSMIWGYNKQYPITKIENATYDDVANSLGISIESVLSLDETDLSQIDSLRSSMPNSMVETYRYKPLIGVTSITDANGLTIYYEYDEFNRIKNIKDYEGNILKSIEYNYREN